MRVLIAFIGMVLSVVACADEAPKYQEGKQYHALAEPIRTDNPDKIEVREMFAYTCGHCFRFDPLLHGWAEQQADDIYLVRTPMVWAGAMEPYARAYYTANTLKVLDESHMDLFNAIHLKRTRFGSVEDFAEFFAQYDIDSDTFIKTFESFGVNSLLRQGDAKARAAEISGTPELVIDGRYRISASDTGGHKQMLEVADYLIEQLRAE
ncbi:thiol:disulfide interchange protein DsbA/DsbL [Gilvimarinus agarilyticus]|uniref:thiol:disulfide interchange protein DsbA/DsbL n=1 Tax=unclassified Gilvimarinus TaxID=2642066 RepID=UPI001C09AE71|nr:MULTISPECIES: thiol:disulfide interchange protein DsbA/DsbL [unclassified Gilvimarinus]MBU2884316.1 thiol:disulfide interchange protein DsbA/DsbL [Gilvimarinus agarilyticus]MDO6569455.1 thiol:disulfide interchange protein DsbA/DsbL [Gilvimarinus sp. 2_MG-2023]MDO6747612.1 thiol:disulfide interchange protein DsbA/DsbL [Gilvimarinus sp. 1_MG-2023]